MGVVGFRYRALLPQRPNISIHQSIRLLLSKWVRPQVFRIPSKVFRTNSFAVRSSNHPICHCIIVTGAAKSVNTTHRSKPTHNGVCVDETSAYKPPNQSQFNFSLHLTTSATSSWIMQNSRSQTLHIVADLLGRSGGRSCQIKGAPFRMLTIRSKITIW